MSKDDTEDFLKTFVRGMHERAIQEHSSWESWGSAGRKQYGEKYQKIYDYWREMKDD